MRKSSSKFKKVSLKSLRRNKTFDDVMITGILVQRWKNMPPVPGTRPYMELALVANNVEVLNKREFSKSN